MTTLAANIDDSQTLLPISGPLTNGTFTLPLYYTVDSESIRVTGRAHRTTWLVERGIAGTTAASHTSGATLTRYYPDAAAGEGGAGSGVTVDNTVDAPFTATTLIAEGATESAPDEATLAGAEEQAVLRAEVVLTDAQTKALPTTPVQIIPAPGAGRVIQQLYVAIQANLVTAYTNVEVDKKFILKLGTAELVNAGFDSALLDSGLPLVRWDVVYLGSAPTTIADDLSNLPLTLDTDQLTDFTAGNAANTLTVTVLYFELAV